MKRATSMFLTLLFAMGVAAQEPASPAPAAGPDQEDPGAKAIREAYEEAIRRDRQIVTMDHTNALVTDVIEDFRKQGGVNIVVDTKNFPEDFRIDRFAVKDEPFRKALEAFAKKAELRVEDETATLIRISRPAQVSFNFRDADVKVVIDMIARISGANIIVSPEVKGTITLSINNVPWDAVLDDVVKTLGFTSVRESFDVIRIIHPDELLKQMETRVFLLRFIQPPPLYKAKLQTDKLIQASVLTPPTQIEELLKRFILKQVLETVLSKDARGKTVGTLNFDPGTNAFVVRDTKVVLDRVEQMLKVLDVEPEQVLIDVKFISTTNSDLLSFGMNYSFGGQDGIGISSSPTAVGTAASPKLTRLPFGFGEEPVPAHQLFMTQYDTEMTFRAFKQDNFTRLVQEPTLAALDNSEAIIFVGDTVAFAETRATSNQSGGVEFSIQEASRSPVKVGFQLFIVPKIVPESNKVILTVIPQNEFLSGGGAGGSPIPGFDRFTVGNQSIDLPQISTSTLVTKLILESGRTAVMGGLVVERATYEDKGIPVLKDLPLVNYLFKQRNDTYSREHLLIFITPRIIPKGNGSAERLQDLLKVREEQERAREAQNQGR